MHCIRSAFLKKQKDMKRAKRKTFDALSVPLICAAYLCLRFLVFPALFAKTPDSAQAYAATGAVYGALVLLLPGGAYFALARLFAEKADEREEKVLLVGTKREKVLIFVSAVCLTQGAGIIPGTGASLPETSGAGYLLLLLALAVISPVCEEFFYRKALMTASRGAGKAAVLFQAALFALAHGVSFGAAYAVTALLCGIIFGAMAFDSKSILLPAICHGTCNAVSLALYAGGGDLFLPRAAMLAAGVFSAASYAASALKRRKRSSEQ